MHEVHGPHLVGSERAGVLDGASRRHVEPVDEHQHDVAAQDRRGRGRRHVVLEEDGLSLVLPVQPEQHEDEDRHDDEHHPGVDPTCHEDRHDDEGREHGPDAVHEHTPLPAHLP